MRVGPFPSAEPCRFNLLYQQVDGCDDDDDHDDDEGDDDDGGDGDDDVGNGDDDGVTSLFNENDDGVLTRSSTVAATLATDWPARSS